MLSWFAAANADKVYGVEFNSDMVKEARKMMVLNKNGYKVDGRRGGHDDRLAPATMRVCVDRDMIAQPAPVRVAAAAAST